MYNEEQKIQEAIASHLRIEYPDVLFTISPVGLNRGTTAMRIRNGADAKRMGYNTGTPDISIYHRSGNFPGLFLEIKTWTGTKTDDQKEFMSKAVKQGYFGAFVYGYDHAKAVIDWYMNLKGGECGENCPVKNDFTNSLYAVISRARRKRK